MAEVLKQHPEMLENSEIPVDQDIFKLEELLAENPEMVERLEHDCLEYTEALVRFQLRELEFEEFNKLQKQWHDSVEQDMQTVSKEIASKDSDLAQKLEKERSSRGGSAGFAMRVAKSLLLRQSF